MSHVEAILTWSAAGPSDAVKAWLTERGFTAASMKVGLLVSGNSELFEEVFGVTRAEPGPKQVDLPIPAELRAHVASVGIPRRRLFGDADEKGGSR
jgi:hypothetical protein